MPRSAQERQEIAALRVAVMEHWDPIGVAGVPQAADEYDSYLYPIWRELRTGSVESLSSYLHFVSSEMMGLSGSPSGEREAAEALFRWWSRR